MSNAVKSRQAAAEAAHPVTASPAGSPSHPREGTKGALLTGMLSRPKGASIDELMSATGWLPHTTRAALTGLRKRGFDIARDRDPVGQSRYRIAQAEPEPASAPKLRRGRKHEAAVGAVA